MKQSVNTSRESIELEAVGISGIPSLDPMVGILHLLVRAKGTTEPVWRLSQADPNRPGYLRDEITAFSEEKRIAMFGDGKAVPVQSTEMAMYVHREFEDFFQKECRETFRQEVDGLRWQELNPSFDAVVAVGSLDILLTLREWAADLLVPKIRNELRDTLFCANKENKTPDLEKFDDFLEKALYSVDSVSGEHYLEFLYLKGVTYLLRGYEAGLANLHRFRASHIPPARSIDDFYREVFLRKKNILDEVDREILLRENSIRAKATTAASAKQSAVFDHTIAHLLGKIQELLDRLGSSSQIGLTQDRKTPTAPFMKNITNSNYTKNQKSSS